MTNRIEVEGSVVPRDDERPGQPSRATSYLRWVVRSRYLPYVTTPLLLGVAIAAWAGYVSIFEVSQYVLPGPGEVFASLADQLSRPHVWQQHIWTTFYETIVGFALGLLVGIVLGFAIGRWHLVEQVATPFVVATQVVPKVALVPLFILWFGFGPSSKVAVAAMLAFFPIMANTALGIKSIPSDMRDMFSVIHAGPWHRFWKLEMPHSLPYILAGAEVGMVLATVGAIVGEYLAGDRGLGRYAIMLQNSLQIPELYASIIMMTIFGFVLYMAVVALRRVLIPWHESVRGTQDFTA